MSLREERRSAETGDAAVIVSAKQGKTDFRKGQAFFIAPVRETLQRARRLLADFQIPAPDTLGALAERDRIDGATPDARQALYRLVEFPLMDQYKTTKLTRVDVEKLLDDYYDESGWHQETTAPTPAKLKELGLENL